MKMALKLVFFLLSLQYFLASVHSITPVVMYHGIGDTADGSINQYKTYLESKYPGIYVLAIQVGKNHDEDLMASYFVNLNTQVSLACKTISEDPNLQNGYNAIGFSQGGQIMRGIVQRCPSPPIRNFISIGGQQQGVYGLPNCPADSNPLCVIVRTLIDIGAYVSLVQNSVVPAQYWHDPLFEDLYRWKSVYLADINNERTPRNESYKANLVKLNNFVMVQFLNETTVYPKESEWFEFYAPGQAKDIVKLRDSPIYQEDWIGLKQLDEAGKLKFLSVVGDHMQFTLEWFQQNIVEPYLL